MPASRMSDSTTRDARNLPNGSSRRVSFGNVEIIELPYALGDNPSVTCGVPISASWKAQKRTKLQLDTLKPIDLIEGQRSNCSFQGRIASNCKS